MRARLVSEAFSEKSDPIKDMGIGVTSKKYKKGDKVVYQIAFPASGMKSDSRPEMSTEKIGRIAKRKRGFMGRIDYEINGLTIPESDIISKVNEVIAQAFSNNTRNQPISGSYPLTQIQYEDVDKPDDISDEEIDCDVCGRPTHPGHFEAGVCKDCAERGYWIDKFGGRHNHNSRIRKVSRFT